MLDATLLEEVPKDQSVCTQEAFGPVAVLSRFNNFQDALDEANDSVVRLASGHLHPRHLQDPKGMGRVGSRRSGNRRRAVMASGQHAIRRRQGQWSRPRRHSLRHGRHDRNPQSCHPHARPHDLIFIALRSTKHQSHYPMPSNNAAIGWP